MKILKSAVSISRSTVSQLTQRLHTVMDGMPRVISECPVSEKLVLQILAQFQT